MVDIDVFAPVIIPTLNRYEHLKRCLDSLKACIHADKTEVIVSLDFPPSEKYREGHDKISEYLDNLQGFRKLTIIKQEQNLGAVANIDFLINYIAANHDRFVFTEDDNEFSPCFLDYINKGLCQYKNDSNVFAICGYNYPINMPNIKCSTFFMPEMSAWGYGTWVDKFIKVYKEVNTPNYLYNFYKDYKLSFYLKDKLRFIRQTPYLGRALMGDVYITTYLHTHNLVNLFPTTSLVRNWGHDGTGVNCHNSQDDKFSHQTISNSFHYTVDDAGEAIRVNEIVYKRYLDYRQPPFKSILKCFILFILIRTYIKFNH